MADDSVIFEIQLEKKILDQIFSENQQLKESYNKLAAKEDTIKTLKGEMSTLQQETERQQLINRHLTDENIELKTNIKQLQNRQLLREVKSRSIDLEYIGSKLLKMKLQKAEIEKANIIEQYGKEKKILEELSRDKPKLLKIQVQLEDTVENLAVATEELKNTKEKLAKMQTENKKLDEDKLSLERQLSDLTKKLRLLEEKSQSNDLEQVESRLLKLKLQSVENENRRLVGEIEKKKQIMSRQAAPQLVKLEDNFKLLRTWIEKEKRPRDDETRSLRDRIHCLESEKLDLIEGFELERNVFRKILKNNKTCDNNYYSHST